MNYLIFKFSCVFGMILLKGSEAAFLSFPRNEMAMRNKSVAFQCSTDSDKPLTWSVTYSERPPGLLDYRAIVLFIRGNLTSVGESKYRIDTSVPGQYNLIMDSVDFSYAGKYKCTEEPFGPAVEAELVVIDSQPVCQGNTSNTDNSVVENDYLWMQCTLSFSDNVNLRMTWIRNRTGSTVHCTCNSSNQSMIVIQVNSSDNGETLMFKATFRQENNSRETVVTWNYTVKVLYIPRNLVVRPLKTVYMVGDRLECSADGNPSPSYEWTETETNRTIDGSVLTIKDNMKSNQNHTFRCTAYNTLAGLRRHISETVTFSVTVAATPPSASPTAVIVSVGATTLMCIVVVIVLLVHCRVNFKAWASGHCVRTAEQEPDVVLNDPMTHYYDIEDLSNEGAGVMTATSTEDSFAPYAETAFSVYESIREENNETTTDGLSAPQQVRAPAYSEVNKNDRQVLKTHQGNNMSDLQSTTRAADTTQTNYFGADGTEYTEVNSFGDRPVAPTPNSSMFRPVDNYAMIDHTRRAPPPLPKL